MVFDKLRAAIATMSSQADQDLPSQTQFPTGDLEQASPVDEDQDAEHDEQIQDDQEVGAEDDMDVDARRESHLTVRQPKHDISVLQNPIPFIVEMRRTLFDVAHPIELKDEEFDRYWPYVDNVWVRQHKAGLDKSGKSTVDYYSCRLQRATYVPKKESRPDGSVPRKKRIREGGTCQARIKISRQDGLIPCLRVQRIGEHEHSHDLDYIDKLKRNSVVMDIARSEVMKGYMPASVFTVLREDEVKLASIGGQFVNRNDVRNTSQAWRTAFKGELGVHPGYRYDVGNGISAVHDPRMMTALQQPAQTMMLQSPTQPALPPDTLFFPPPMSNFMAPYLPDSQPPRLTTQMPFVTLTYATSLDSFLSLGPSIPTPISGPTSKAMTHHLRAHHDAILIGAGTAIADNPGLNCRIAGAGGYGGLGWSSQPRPVIIDPSARWDIRHESKILVAARAGKGKGPWIIVAPGTKPSQEKIKLLAEHGGKFLGLTSFDARYRLSWEGILRALSAENIKSVMIEGGGAVINELLRPENLRLVDSVVITIAPTYLGTGGVGVAPAQKSDAAGNVVPAIRFQDVRWQPLGEDVVMCGRVQALDGGGHAQGLI